MNLRDNPIKLFPFSVIYEDEEGGCRSYVYQARNKDAAYVKFIRDFGDKVRVVSIRKLEN